MTLNEIQADEDVWYSLPLWPGYELSCNWQLRATPIPNGPPRGGIKKFTVSTNGYPVICLWRDGRKYTVYLHRIIAELAYGPIPTGLMVLHQNDNKSNCFPSNLGIGTQAVNMQDAIKNRRTPIGDSCPWAKLSDADVREIRFRLASGAQNIDLAREFNVSLTAISDVRTGRKWKHVS